MGMERMVCEQVQTEFLYKPNYVWLRVPDLTLSPQHPKRVFMRRTVDHEIRLSYYDRIHKTLPEPMQSPDLLVIAADAPGPDYEYDDPGEYGS